MPATIWRWKMMYGTNGGKSRSPSPFVLPLFGRRFGNYPQDLVLWIGYQSTRTADDSIRGTGLAAIAY